MIVRLIDLSGPATGAAYSRSDVVEALHEHQPAVVAVSSSGTLVGAVVARVSGPDAHLIDPRAPSCTGASRASARPSSARLDQEIIHRGARRLLAVVLPRPSR